MARISPTLEGFRAALRRPSFTFAEIAWRWSVGATAAALLLFGLFEFLDTLPVTNGELLFLRTRQPYLVAEAILHILRGGLSRGLISLLLAVLLLTIVWMVVASVGRYATVRALLEYFRSDASRHISPESAGEGEVRQGLARDLPGNSAAAGSLFRLNFLRATVVVAGIFGLIGAAILAGFASPSDHPQPGVAFLLFVPLAVMVWLAVTTLNWMLSLACVFAVRDRESAIGALFAAITFFRERWRAVTAVSLWTAILHLSAFMLGSSVVTFPLAFAPILPWRLMVLLVGGITLVYFAIADWIYMARLAGYVFIAETPEALLAPPLPPVALVPPSIQTEIDRAELILSDVPNPATA